MLSLVNIPIPKQKPILRLEPLKKVGQLWTVPSIGSTVLVVYTNGVEFVTTVVVFEKKILKDLEKFNFKKYPNFRCKNIEYIILHQTEGPMLAAHLKKYVGTSRHKYKFNQNNTNISNLEIKLLEKIEPLRIDFYTLFESRNVLFKKYNNNDVLDPNFNATNVKDVAKYFIK